MSRYIFNNNNLHCKVCKHYIKVSFIFLHILENLYIIMYLPIWISLYKVIIK